MAKEKVVLAYSGGLDTSIIIPWLIENYDYEVIAVCGDGSFQMSMMELAALRQHGVGVKILVFANNRLGMVAEYQRDHGGGETAVCLDGSPDFVRLAEAYGIPARRLSMASEIPAALDALLSAEGPFLLEAAVDPEEPTLPPHPLA